MDTPQMSPKKANSPILWVILIVVLLAAIAVAVYAYWNKNQNSNTNANQNTNVVANINTDLNTNDADNSNTALNTNTTANLNTSIDTSGWETFSSSKYGFSLKMPPLWKVTQSSVSRDTFKYESFGVNPGVDKHAGYQVNVYNSVEDLADGSKYSTLAEWIVAQETGPYVYPSTDYLGQRTYEGLWPSADETYSFYIEHGGRVYNINMNWTSPENRTIDPTTKRAVFNLEEEAFLKSFKFL